MKFWLGALDIEAATILSPYAQVMQQLLDSGSAMAQNQRGFNVLLIRPEDWVRDRTAADRESNASHLREVAREFISALRALRARTDAPTLVFLCPASSELAQPDRQMLTDIERDLAAQSSALPNTYSWTDLELRKLYPTDSREDPRSDRIGHIPYTQEYFAAIAALITRRIATSLKPRCKVVAVDCDNTLWRGVCGEDGPDGVEIAAGYMELQRMLVRLHDAGVLLCLCSKNNAEDVSRVFAARPGMPLREEHFVSSRVNWESKSSNLQSLAAELDLALGSFIFIDDSPIECAEVRAHCPEVLTLQLPQAAAEIAHFVDHVWAFDLLSVTDEAKRRTQMYRQNRARNQALTHATDLDEFLATLELQVEVGPMQRTQLARVAELIQRTTQFNLTGIRRHATELEALRRAGDVDIWVVNVADRFGDYGLVGAILFRTRRATIEVDTFVLSCRALGRGVEHRIVNELAQLARRAGCSSITLRYRQTARNAPARKFLEQSFQQWEITQSERRLDASERWFEAPVELVALWGKHPVCSDEVLSNAEAARTVIVKSDADQARFATLWHETALKLSRVADMLTAVGEATARLRQPTGSYVAPRTPAERAIAEIWRDILGLQQVGVGDDFFDLGGDSLLAVRAIARIGSVLSKEISIYDFFEGPTVEAVALKLADAATRASSIQQSEAEGPAPLSSTQERVWFIDRLEGSSIAYHIAVTLNIEGELHRVALQEALNALLERHQALRTVVTEVGGKAAQKVRPATAFALRVADLQELAPRPQQQAMQRCVEEELRAPFDLREGPLIRGVLLQTAVNQHLLLLVMHHIVSDGWSVNVLLRELGIFYDKQCGRQSPELPPLPLQYVDYARWQRQAASDSRAGERLGYWVRHLRGAPALLELPTDRPRPQMQSHRGATLPVTVDLELTRALKSLSRRHELTLAMTLQVAWAILLARLSGQNDVVIGMPVTNRPRSELEGLVGFFVNTVAVRMCMDDDPGVAQLLRRSKGTLLDAYSHQDVPLDHVVEALQPVRSLSHSPLFQVMFDWPAPFSESPGWAGLVVTPGYEALDTAQFDLSLSLQESPEGIVGGLNYATDLFDEATIGRWIRSFMSLLEAVVGDQEQPVSRLPLLLSEERRQLLEHFNATSSAYRRDKVIHELIEEQAERTPHAAAVTYEGQSLTYAELNARANQLSRHLRGLGVEAGKLVGICVERSLEMLIGLLGVWKAGAAYVPLDPSYPAERLQYMLTDASPLVVLTQAKLRDRLPATSAEVLALDSDWRKIGDNASHRLGSSGLLADRLAYVLYTSGSTGQPKGVMIDHASILNLHHGLDQLYRRTRGCARVALNASFNFDASVQQFVQLIDGRTLHLVPYEARRDPRLLLEFLKDHHIEAIDCTPSQCKSWVAAGLLERNATSLRLVLVGGEPIEIELWKRLASCAHIDFYNVYGPTECTVDSTAARITGDMTAPHIGTPMPNRRIYVLGAGLQPAPLGVVGEIYIGGDGVGRGYLNRPELTLERFMRDPFGADPWSRMYKTGDLGRWRADGVIECLGRNDHQVKIRGFRIELGEIEAQLLRHERVKEAVVVAREDAPGEKQLVAYVASHEGSSPPSAEELRTHLHATLPAHMAPSAFVHMESMPLTPNGKLDRQALPAPERGAYASQRYHAPQGDVEETLAEIWRSLLQVQRIGRQDNFFELGGHSLLVMQAIARIESQWSLDIPMRSMFDCPTLSEFAAHIEELRSSQLLERVAAGGAEIEDLLETLASMPESRARELLQETTAQRGL